jgi:hypothetical protein
LGTARELAVLHLEQGETDEVVSLLEDVLRRKRANGWDTHADTLETMTLLATANKATNRLEEMKRLDEQLLEQTLASAELTDQNVSRLREQASEIRRDPNHDSNIMYLEHVLVAQRETLGITMRRRLRVHRNLRSHI